MRHRWAVAWCVLASLAGTTRGNSREGEERPFALMVGDPAPPLTVKKWFQRGPIASVEAGKPFVVEFWATWCIPCVAGIPHLTELQSRYARQATIVGVAVWEQDLAETERYITGQGDRMRYLVAIDDVPPMPAGTENARMWLFEQGRMSRAWLKASGQTGIPVAFIVDVQGRIAWIGEPQQMDEPLARIVEGSWDLKAFEAKYRERMTAKAKSEPIAQRLEDARRRHDAAAALAAAEELIGLGPSMAKYAGDKFDVLLNEIEDIPRAEAYAREAIGGVTRDDSQGLNRIASVILKRPKGPGRDLDLALEAAERSEQVTHGKHSRTLKLLAEVLAARGEYPEAAEVQRRAVAVAYPEEKPEFEQQLAKYERRSER
jgi:thiol-disulfide isomerase/thioredoxin